ncbi:hypothetical protein N7513_003658 [Penicillium frequentans]|nr:hypothetical protein N7513_003658 [Penicillium glabrum]
MWGQRRFQFFVAFITGANGITGSAIMDRLTKYTTSDEWSRIVLTSRSPLTLNIADPRVEFIALDFTKSPEELVKRMKVICTDVTHAYFSSYVHKGNFKESNMASKSLFTGGKYYNVHIQPVQSPASEVHARLVAPEENFNYHQEDFLADKQRGSSWTWNISRPEAIVGYATKPDGLNGALTLALYFLIARSAAKRRRCPRTGTSGMAPTISLTRDSS